MSKSKKYITRDSGKRSSYSSGMVRDICEDKPRYDLIPIPMLKRLAELYTRGANKYGVNNWQKANSEEELEHAKASAFRHFIQWLENEEDEDHAVATVWNIFTCEYIKDKLAKENK